MAETFAEAQELQRIAERLYPTLSADEAYLALQRDVLEHMLDGSLEVAKIGALSRGNAGAAAAIELGQYGKKKIKSLVGSIKASSAASQPRVDNLTVEAGSIPAQRTTRIVEDLASPLPGPSQSVAQGAETAAAGGSLRGKHAQGIPAGLSHNASLGGDASALPGRSLLESIDYLACWNTVLRSIQVAQGYQAIKALNVIAEHLGDSNCIAVSGAGGPDGFARPVYDFINKKINEIDPEERQNHRFFVYHDSTNWHPAFDRLTRENPLPPEFVNIPSDNLDHMCLFMREVRQQLVARDPQRGEAMVFHLLIPSWAKLCIKEPLHFPDDLYPLQIEGVTHGGKAQVELNLTAAPRGLLHGVANGLDPDNWDMIASGTSTAVVLTTAGGVNGACMGLALGVASLTGIGVLAPLIFFGSSIWATEKVVPAIGNATHDSLREEAPRVLGSNQRLEQKKQYR
jgi:hypothetical protein